MKQPKTLAVIGSRGMLGSDLTRYLKPYFQNITEIDKENYDKYRGQQFDVVINANGNNNKIWANENVLADFAASTASVYKTLLDFPCKTYVYISSADVYPDHTNKKFTDESKAIAVEKLSSYGLHKYLSECIVKNFSKNHITLRCPMILGTNLKKGPVYDILHSFHLFINPKSSFQTITTAEIAKIISLLIEKNIINEVFNIGGQDKVSLNEITKYLKKTVTSPKDGQIHTYEMDVSKLNRIYPLKTSAQYLKDFLKNSILSS